MSKGAHITVATDTFPRSFKTTEILGKRLAKSDVSLGNLVMNKSTTSIKPMTLFAIIA
jgi:hypothetical protein